MIPEGAVIAERFVVVRSLQSYETADDYLVHEINTPNIQLQLRIFKFTTFGLGHEAAAALKEQISRASTVHHPSVVHVFEHIEHEGDIGYVCEIAGGTTVSALLQKRDTSDEETLRILIQAALGLEALHAAGVYCPSLTPEDISVSLSEVRILASAQIGSPFVANRDSNLSETLRQFSAPELAGATQRCGSANIYSLGRIGYELYRNTPARAQFGQPGSELPPLTQVDPIFPRVISRVLEKAMAPVPERRQASAAELVIELSTAQQSPWTTRTSVNTISPESSKELAVRDTPNLRWDESATPPAAQLSGNSKFTWSDFVTYLRAMQGTPVTMLLIGSLILAIGFTKKITEPTEDLLARLTPGTFHGSIEELSGFKKNLPIGILSTGNRQLAMVGMEGCAAETLVINEPYACDSASLLFEVESATEIGASGTVRLLSDPDKVARWYVTKEFPPEPREVAECPVKDGTKVGSPPGLSVIPSKKKYLTISDTQRTAEIACVTHAEITGDYVKKEIDLNLEPIQEQTSAEVTEIE